MKIYTKQGDKGTTSLLGGTKISKAHIQIESYGNVDELNSHIGLLRDSVSKNHQKDLIKIQDRLFTIGSLLANDGKKSKIKLPKINPEDIQFLENKIDSMFASLPEMRSFVLPGGHPIVSYCHISRCVCRRAERSVVHLSEKIEVDENSIIYLNRLSDYLFALARKLSQELCVEEIPWIPKM